MINALPSNPPVTTLAHLLDALGNVPPARVWLIPTPGTATEADVVAAEQSQNRLCELIEGTLVEKTMGFSESRVAIVLAYFLEEFIGANDLGIVLGADGMFRLAPRLVRIPDVAYVSWERLPGREMPTKAIPELAPDLAVEVLSASNTPKEMKRKLGEYFQASVEQVWFVEPDERTFEIFTSPRKSKVYGKEDTIKSKILPGFSLSIAMFFKRVERRGH